MSFKREDNGHIFRESLLEDVLQAPFPGQETFPENCCTLSFTQRVTERVTNKKESWREKLKPLTLDKSRCGTDGVSETIHPSKQQF